VIQALKNASRRLGRFLLWPARRFFDPRFAGLEAAIRENVQVTLDATDLLGRSIADVRAAVDEANSRLVNVQAEAEKASAEAEKASGSYFERLMSGRPSDLDDKASALLSHEGGSRGLAAQSGLWFNPPVSIEYRPGAVEIGHVNERAAEMPYVFRGLAGLPSGARVLDVGAAESTVALSLASLGYEVTALDPRSYPFSHPRLVTVASTLEDWNHDGVFDAVVCLSTIEHLGLAAYGQEPDEDRADLAAMRRLHELTRPGGRLLLTTRFGEAGADSFQRTYDHAGLAELLAGWQVDDESFVRREDDATWVAAEPKGEAGAELVVLVTATRPE
jgi:2-polyprenyl-3-methyl-5-hydroxy-6-metoxy-1,4-benzoquinol methylase